MDHPCLLSRFASVVHQSTKAGSQAMRSDAFSASHHSPPRPDRMWPSCEGPQACGTREQACHTAAIAQLQVPVPSATSPTLAPLAKKQQQQQRQHVVVPYPISLSSRLVFPFSASTVELRGSLGVHQSLGGASNACCALHHPPTVLSGSATAPTNSSVAAGPATANIDFTRTYPNVGYVISKEQGGGGGGGAGYTENWSSLIGIITAIVGNVLISFALNMQRYAHIRLDREWQEKERLRKKRSASSASLAQLSSRGNGKDGKMAARPGEDVVDASESDALLPRPSMAREGSDDTSASGEEEAYKHKSYLKSPYWWLGIILMTIGEAGNFLAYGFAPASIVSPLGVVALISNCIIAPFMLKEPFRKRDALGVIIAVGGAVTVVLSANSSNPKLGPDEIWHLITRWEFETYFGITAGVIIALMVASNRFGEKSVLIDLGLVGLLGGYTALSTKGVSSLLSYTLWRAITFPIFYLLVAILVGTAIMQIKYVNRALQRFDATQVIPVQFVLFTLSVIGGSAVLYRDFERTSGEDAGKFIGGCALTFFGVWLITSGRPKQNEDEDEDREPEPEDAINLITEGYADEVANMSENSAANTRRSSTTHRLSPSNTNNFPFYASTDTSRPTTPSINIIPDATTSSQNHTRPATAEDKPHPQLSPPTRHPPISTSPSPPPAQPASNPDPKSPREQARSSAVSD
ncbi:hypothetical protein LEMA_P022040.1 [Plenodomus lingam JN3]|uniref:DUF803 domain membrane protein n=1 Tax=Leptosphaeria maculans (strain JN3 / isolate v23.1.3 / race Av1-4-5-6-7-8) TaxID=985895 RepID=E5ABN3_LEPMJ|nr:hypothetical protein LEMA_P022040.1 [Plenodomus lingam JN3]CBY01074.1 hypothetical protein LEMA_P022040.1 [Plenodomus lingam JN3]